MTKIRPFKATRPPRNIVSLVASRPYYTYKKKILAAKLKSNKYTFLHVINPEFSKEDRTKPNTNERFLKVKEKYQEFLAKSYFKKDLHDNFYIYRQKSKDNDFVGIIAGASVQEYLEGKIKIHEHTITEREETFKRYLDICQFNAEPVLLTYPDHKGIDAVIEKYVSKRSEYEYTSTDEKTHDLWLVDNKQDQENLMRHFEEIESVYIADGHHRSASAVLYSEQNEDKNNPLHKYFLSYFIAESKLKIYDYNRIVTSLNELSVNEFLVKLEEKFIVKKMDVAAKPHSKNNLTMIIGENNYLLVVKPEYLHPDDSIKSLDTQILNDYILEPILDIHDIKTDKRVLFVSGTKGIKGLKSYNKKMNGKVAFALYPVSIEELKRVADEKKIMPPKSTWIEPKLRSGLTIYEYQD